MPKDYAATLYALGAVPIGTAVRGFRGDETGQTVYVKGERVAISGWLSPYWVNKGDLLSTEARARYDASMRLLAYEDYVALLDVDEYMQTRDPDLFAVIAFVLQSMLQEGVTIQSLDQIVEVYEADIGLDEYVIPLLKGNLSSDQAMDLYELRGNVSLLGVFPVPQPGDNNYVQFLNLISESEPTRQWIALGLLYRMDPESYQDDYRDSLIRTVDETDSWPLRVTMYQGLVEIGDDRSKQSLATFVLSDPVTEAREAIIGSALASEYCTGEFMDSMVQLAQGLGASHESVTPGRMQGQWESIIREYLRWAKEADQCDSESRTVAEEALGFLDRHR